MVLSYLPQGLATIVVIATVLLAFLWAVGQLVELATKGTRKETASHNAQPPRARTEANPYRHRTSRLDLQGELLQPWRTPRSGATPATDLSGWGNFLIVCLGIFVASNALHACLASSRGRGSSSALGDVDLALCFVDASRWFLDRGAAAFAIFTRVPALLRDIGILVLAYGILTYGVQAAVTHGCLRRSPRAALAAQVLVELILFFGPVVYARSSACEEWPAIQRLALLLESSVLTMKAHSYIVVNRHLAWEVALGGPGTGEQVLEWTSQQQKQQNQESNRAAESTLGSPTTADVADGIPANARSAAEGEAAPAPRPSSAVPPFTTPDTSATTTTTTTTTTTRGEVRSSPLRRRKGSEGVGATPGRGGSIASTTPSDAGLPLSEEEEAERSSYTGDVRGTLGGGGLMGAAARALAVLNAEMREDARVGAVEAAAAKGRASGSSIDVSRHDQAPESPPPPAAAAAGEERRGEEVAAAAAAAPAPRHARVPSARALHQLLQSAGALLRGVSREGRDTTLESLQYPKNVTLKDFVVFSVAPTLCYEPNFPRTTSLEVGYIVEKIFLAAGLVAAGVYIFSSYMRPVLEVVNDISLIDAVAQLMLPTIACTLIVFFVAFECVLNGCAELTYFADRGFYADWFNSTSFTEFSRKWNHPVHEFLLRHVYLDLMRRRGIKPSTALYLTYIVSIVAHEVVIYGGLGPVTPYLAVMSFAQFPLMSLLRLPIFRGKRLGNLVFWACLITGITAVFTLYCREYIAGQGANGSAGEIERFLWQRYTAELFETPT